MAAAEAEVEATSTAAAAASAATTTTTAAEANITIATAAAADATEQVASAGPAAATAAAAAKPTPVFTLPEGAEVRRADRSHGGLLRWYAPDDSVIFRGDGGDGVCPVSPAAAAMHAVLTAVEAAVERVATVERCRLTLLNPC